MNMGSCHTPFLMNNKHLQIAQCVQEKNITFIEKTLKKNKQKKRIKKKDGNACNR